MSENLRMYQRAMYGLDGVVRRMPADAWDTQSKCADWTCREVIGHSIWGVARLAGALGQGEAFPEAPEAEVAGDDPAATWVGVRDRVLVGLDQPGALTTEADSPFGRATVDSLLRIAASDLFAHTWDIGAAAGIDPALDPSVAAAMLPGLQAFGDGLRSPGLMGPEVEVARDASIVDRYLAYCGRDPS